MVLLYASRYDNIHAVVNVSGCYDLKRGVEEMMDKVKKDGFVDIENNTGSVAFRLTEESLMDLLSINMDEECLKIPRECR